MRTGERENINPITRSHIWGKHEQVSFWLLVSQFSVFLVSGLHMSTYASMTYTTLSTSSQQMLLLCLNLIKLSSSFAVQFLQSPSKFLKLSRYLPMERIEKPNHSTTLSTNTCKIFNANSLFSLQVINIAEINDGTVLPRGTHGWPFVPETSK